MFSRLDLRPAAQTMRTNRDSLQTASPPFCRWFQCVPQLAVLGLVLGGIACSSARSAFADADEAQAKVGEQEAHFESHVRPLLVSHCVECHGPDEQGGELRLDRQLGFRKGGASGPVVVAGDPNASRLIRAVGYQDNELQMPPDHKLSDEEIAVLTEWVRQGASWPDDSTNEAEEAKEMSMTDLIDTQREQHWSYQPIVASQPPTIDELKAMAGSDAANAIDAQAITAIDQFVLAKLFAAGLSPNPPADRRTLIHRAYFTLIGLPPSYEEVQAFLADEQPDAFARLVDRLLDNPHYGERWARHWLDLARYGDTKGYLAGNQETRYPFAYTYRDYVIDAFNHDKPFDRFILEQLAADQLDLTGEQRAGLAAMGFLTVGRRFMNREQDIIDDQIDVVTRGFLGMSVACARCHDHKYDPVPTADYYSLYGVFASSQEPDELPLLGEPTSSPEYEAFLQEKAAKQKEVDQWLEERCVETAKELRSRVADYLVAVASTKTPSQTGQTQFEGKRGPLRRAAMRQWRQYLENPSESSHPVWQLWHQLAAIPESEFATTAPGVLDKFAPTENAGPQDGEVVPRTLVDTLRAAHPQTMQEAAQILGDCLEGVHGRFEEARKADANLDRLPGDDDEALRQVLWLADSPTTIDIQRMISYLDQGERDRYNGMLNGVNGVEVSHPGAPPRGMVLVDRGNLVEPVIFRRGVASNRGDSVPRRFLQVLSHVDGGQPFQQGSGRLELARAIANPDNPLTARVIVNRIWQHHFGEGLVRTPSDFGMRGELPTHPELLDNLAAQFMADGWSIKRLQRRIMLSATWQQSSDLREDAMKSDPENRLLWQMPRRRMEFEPLRDRLLVAAGRLDDRVGGRSAMIHKDATRRGLYAYIDREDLPGLLASFDVPSPDASQAKRTETTVPQQALYLMNSEFAIEQAKALAARSGQATADPAERIRSLYRFALSRDPNVEELTAASEFVTPPSIGSTDSSDEGESIGADAKADGEGGGVLDPWVELAQVLLLCNEFAFVD